MRTTKASSVTAREASLATTTDKEVVRSRDSTLITRSQRAPGAATLWTGVPIRA